jgi:CRISPR-associated endonuclease/helicase Cas3
MKGIKCWGIIMIIYRNSAELKGNSYNSIENTYEPCDLDTENKDSNFVYYARKDSNGNVQLLETHLYNVAALSSSFSYCPNISKLMGLLHDLGKATNSFQKYLENGGERGSVIHAFQGAFYGDEISCAESAPSVLLKDILEMVIISHHNELRDGISPDGLSVFFDILNRKADQKLYYTEVKRYIQADSNLNENIRNLVVPAQEEINEVIKLIQRTFLGASRDFAVGLFSKYIYSCLVDSDRLDAYLFEANEPYIEKNTDWDYLITIFENNICGFSAQREIDRIRKDISEKCKSAAIKETGIYQLSVPTGGGKTLSSLRFALHHTKKYNKKRIIYVIPYLSIIEQTSESIRKILNLDSENEILLENHSNIVPSNDDDERSARKLAASRWDKPIIVTTMVQFLETVMSARGSKLRKFHHMQEAVIIFDEIQSLPLHSIHLFNETISFLSKILNSTILLCTATQPRIGYTERKNLLLSENCNLIENTAEAFQKLKRTEVVMEKSKTSEELIEFILEKADENKNCLVIVNTKKQARQLYEGIKKAENASPFIIFHLSTSMCPAHRFNVLNEVKSSMDKNCTKVICVSTQLIEAGVDISFDCVIRSMAGLDSIIQAAGRCNRNGNSQGITKKTYIIPLDENLDKLLAIQYGKDATMRVINEKSDNDFLSQEALDSFYKYYYSVRENKGIMDFPAGDKGSVYEMLSKNRGVNNYKSIKGEFFPHILSHAFESADKSYSVIENNTQPVVVCWKESEALIDAFIKAYAIKDKIFIIRKLERFSVSLYEYEINKAMEKGALKYLENDEFGIKILDKNFYSDEIGATLESDIKQLII